MARLNRSARAPRLATSATAVLLALALALAVASDSPAAGAGRHRPYTTTPGSFRANPTFVVTYRGSGTWRTVYHGTPPNPGGKPDRNDAKDSSTQAWRLRFRRRVAIPTCGQPTHGGSDPCARLTGPIGATGATTATGRIRHSHVDGLYRSLSASVKCRLRKRTKPSAKVDASIGLRYAPDSGTIGVTAYNPVTTVLTALPGACRSQGDSLDRLLDNYFTPGFSFDPAYDVARWFTSRTVSIPAAAFHRSATIAIRLADTRAGTPPRRCAVPDRKIERCTTGGSWAGVLKLTRRP